MPERGNTFSRDSHGCTQLSVQAIVTKGKNEPLGIVIVESGWGSMLPTVVIANMMPGGPAAR